MQQFNPQGVPLTWSQTWIRVLTQPSELTFQAILSDPTASNQRAYTWVACAALVQSALLALVYGTALLSMETRRVFNPDGLGDTGFIWLMVGVFLAFLLLAPLLSVISLIINVAITQFIAKLLGGTGTYGELTYATAAYIAPLGLLAIAVSTTPLSFCIAPILGIYGMILNVTAVKAVNKFSWLQAILSIFIIPLLIGVIGTIIFLSILSGARPR
jgi:hypothetical protein